MSSRRLAAILTASLAAAAIVVTACGPRGARDVIPSLPGDGDSNVAKPPTTPAPVAARDPWTGRKDLIQPPGVLPPRPVQLPKVERFALPNGLEVIVVPNDRLPVVQMQLAIKAGRADEPLARLGVAELTANVLPKGTKKRDALAIANAIDFAGGAITADAGHEATWVTCSVLTKDQKVCLDLLSEMMTAPRFADVELTKAKESLLADVMRRLDDAGAMAGAQVTNLLWGNDHVRGWVLGADHVRQLTRADVVAWHKTWYTPNNAILAVSGAVDPARLKADLGRAFAAWKKAPVPARPKYAEPPLTGPRIRLVDKPGQTQTQIRVAQYGLRHDDVRFFPSLVWNYALGGGAFNSRLMKVVRSEGGKTYGASSTFDRNLDRGGFVATTFTRTAETVKTLELVLGEIRKMHASGPTDDEVAAAIANLAGSYAMRVAGASDLASQLVTAELHDLSQAYVSDFPVLVGKVSRGDAADAAASVLSPNAFAVVLVGDGNQIAPQLDRAGLKYERVKFDAPIGPQPARADVPVDPKTAAAGLKILDAALAAKGGARLAKLKALRLSSEGTLAAQGQKVDVTFDRLLVMPDKMRMDIQLAKQFRVVFAVVGDKGWTQGPAGIEDIPAAQLPQLARQRWVDPEFVLLRHREPGAKVRALPAAKVGTVTCDVVEVTSGDGTYSATLYLDPKTKLLVQLAYSDGAVQTLEQYGDYKDVGGIKIAHQRDASGGGESSSLKVLEVELDPAVEASAFARPKP
ncbi:MAG TPA: insulinase family protein [Kofleriaceae bacterium]|nr:insulinase family protein [Kofleriaceae bacterium]